MLYNYFIFLILLCEEGQLPSQLAIASVAFPGPCHGSHNLEDWQEETLQADKSIVSEIYYYMGDKNDKIPFRTIKQDTTAPAKKKDTTENNFDPRLKNSKPMVVIFYHILALFEEWYPKIIKKTIVRDRTTV